MPPRKKRRRKLGHGPLDVEIVGKVETDPKKRKWPRQYAPVIVQCPDGWKADWTPADGDQVFLFPPNDYRNPSRVCYVATLKPNQHYIAFSDFLLIAERRRIREELI